MHDSAAGIPGRLPYGKSKLHRILFIDLTKRQWRGGKRYKRLPPNAETGGKDEKKRCDHYNCSGCGGCGDDSAAVFKTKGGGGGGFSSRGIGRKAEDGQP